MARIEKLSLDRMTEVQRRIHDQIGAARGGNVGGPFAIWLRHPKIADAANQLGNALRLDGTLDARLFELAILVVARNWTAQYEWYAHAKAALDAGLPVAIVDAIREGRRPDLADPAQHLVYDLTEVLLRTRRLDETMYRRAIDLLGEDAMVELAAVIGFYTMVAITLNVFDVPVPDGTRPMED